MWDVKRTMIKSIRVDLRIYMENSKWEKNAGLSQAVESSECQTDIWIPFYRLRRTPKISKQSNIDLIEMDSMYLEGRKKLVVIGQIMESWLRWEW